MRKKEISLTVWLKNDTEAAHRVVLKNLVREAGTDKVANIFGDREEGLEAGEAKPIEVKRTWADPKLWGFGEYGEPALYMLRTELRAADSGEGATSTLDTLNTRFGYREFWTSGRHFMFNGKPFLIKGDVISPPLTLVNNREFITLLYQAERGANINFLRLDDPTGFAHDTWYEVADEMGMLVEPQSCRQVKKGNEEAAADEPDKPFEALKDEWEKFVKDAGNHPSIVMYNCDNETASQAQDIVSGDVFKWINDLHQTIRNADPTRVIEEQGDVQLAAGRNFGIIKELQVFNVHPYGAPLGPVLEEIKKKYDYGNNIPIHVGEIHPGEKDPLAVLPAPAGMLKDKAQVFQAFKGAGDYFAASAKGVNEVGAAGMSLMSGFGTMYFGPKSAEEMQFGPWDVRATDEAPGAKGKLVNCVFVKPRWPSLSGEGMKVCWMDASTNPRGSGNEFNWFDPTRPAYLTNITYDLVTTGVHDLDGKDVAPLAGKRAGEVVVGLAPDGKPLAGAYVFLTKKGQELMGDTGVMTDAAGTAWFTPEEPGDYEAWTMVDGKRMSSEVRVQSSELTAKAGYAHVTWVDLTPGATAKIKDEMAKAAVVETRK